MNSTTQVLKAPENINFKPMYFQIFVRTILFVIS